MRPTFLPSLTGLRGAAALWVVIFHMGMYLDLGELRVHELGYLGVDLFFILSGFILGHVHTRDFIKIEVRSIMHFLFLRLSRIYPVHAVTLLAAMLYAVAIGLAGAPVLQNERYDPSLILDNLLLVQAWGWNTHDSFNVVAWSISAEWMAYIAFPFLAFFLGRVSGRMAFLFAIVALSAEIVAFIMLGQPDMNARSTLAILRVSGEFTCGLCLYMTYRSGLLDWLSWGWITDLACAGAILAASARVPTAVVPCFAIIVLGLSQGRGIVAELLARQRMLLLGELSYSLYMTHLLIMEAVFSPLTYSRLGSFGLAPRIVIMLIAVAIISLVTVLLHGSVEVPARTWLRRRLDGFFTASPSSAVAVKSKATHG